jgi:spore photoproduct lyase
MSSIVFLRESKVFERIFVERAIVDHPRVLGILDFFKSTPVSVLESFDESWGQFKKPYLHKRDRLHLYLAKKNGHKVKLAPDAYGVKGEKHYYFVHAYNCIYECEYCYLQGYFNTPDLVLFINHEEILQEMLTYIGQERVWFHAGEFSDSLALSHITGELKTYFDFFQKHPQAYLELRTKSANIRELKKLLPLNNVIISFSLSPERISKTVDRKTATLKARVQAMRELQQIGFRLAIHLDPIIAMEDFSQQFRELFSMLKDYDLLRELCYVSIGVVRFTSDVLREVEKNYPDSILLAQNFVKADDNKIKYSTLFRKHVLQTVFALGVEAGLKPTQMYFCMEEGPV